MAIDSALQVAEKTSNASVPLYLRNAPTKLMEQLGYADGYKYAHDFPGHFADLEFMPDSLKGTVFYQPQSNRHEESLSSYLEKCWPKYYGPDKKQK
jgi:putative ATPase